MKKHFKIAIQMDPLQSINIKSDSTYILALEAQKRGHKLFHYLPENLIYENGRVSALGSVFKLFPNKKIFFTKSKTQKIFLDDYDVVLVRQDPPFNMSYITATYLLESISDKTLILNDPKSIRDNPEKLSMFNFKSIIPPTLISKNIEQCFNFQKKYKKTIIKPLYGNGGEGISKLEGTNAVLKKKILKLINKYKQPVVIQKYLTEIKEGDRRIILIDGEYGGSVARIPKKGSVTANFHTGGIAKKVGLVRRDKKICNILKPFLKKNKLFFTGIDVIGNYLTEINVTSPTGIQEINRLNGVRLEKLFWDRVEKKLR